MSAKVNTHPAPIEQVPTNIITGFLGVGKTTAILHLLRHKPVGERWAILVNEFGEVGIDGALITGQHSEEQGVFIREVPGGCMCCAAGLPMQIALNMLIARSRPDRLLIEPTGLGHPEEVIQSLQSEQYRSLIQLQTVLTLVDARQLGDSRYTDNATFNQQLRVADLVVAHKADLYEADELTQLSAYLKSDKVSQDAPIIAVAQGELDPQYLLRASRHQSVDAREKKPLTGDNPRPAPVAQSLLPLSVALLPPEGFLRFSQRGDGFYSLGWIFKADFRFDRIKLQSLFVGLGVTRLKAVLQLDNGWMGFNLVDGILSETALDHALDNRVELISLSPVVGQDIEQALQAAVTYRP